MSGRTDRGIFCSSANLPKLRVSPRCLTGLLCSILIITAASASAQSYSFKTLDDPNATGPRGGVPPRTMALGTNDSGVIVGSYSNGGNVLHAFQFTGGSFSVIDFPGVCGGSNCGSEARGINNSGVVVGDYTDDSLGNTYGYTLVNGSYTTLEFPGAAYTQPNDVNNHGVIVGLYQDGNYVTHGFTFDGGFSTFDWPAGGIPDITAVNDAGDMVGWCICKNGASSVDIAFKFTAATGQITPISFPGAIGTRANGINNSGQIVGNYNGPGGFHGFLLSQGSYFTIDPPGSVFTEPGAINNNGQIVGDYADSGGTFHGFLATKARLVDPVPNLLSGSAVRTLSTVTDAQVLANQGRTVQGVAADGVAQVVVIVPTNNVGDQFLLTVLNDSSQTQSTLPNEDGALGNPGDTSFSQTQLNITAVATSSDLSNPTPMAFAVYQSPIDFARPVSGGNYKAGSCNGVSTTDDLAGCRTVTIAVQNQATGVTSNMPVIILRPPVVLIHGLWGSSSDWDHFSPLVTGPGTLDGRFSGGPVNYDYPVGPSIAATNPSFPTTLLKNISANALGLDFNWPGVLGQMQLTIGNFKAGLNPAGAPVAGIQADVVGHSMGGLVARTIALQPTFLGGNTFGQGNIHKLITVDTPHLGSPLAIALLSSAENGGCLQNLLAKNGDFALALVTFSGGYALSGAIADLQGDDTIPFLSSPLTALNSISPHPLPTALIARIYQDFAALDSFPDAAFFIRNWPRGCTTDPLAQGLTSSGWPALFHNEANDAIVSEASQLAGLDSSLGFPFFGYAHSPGTTKLGFSNPTVMGAGAVSTEVIFLLNKPWTTPTFYNLLNP